MITTIPNQTLIWLITYLSHYKSFHLDSGIFAHLWIIIKSISIIHSLARVPPLPGGWMRWHGITTGYTFSWYWSFYGLIVNYFIAFITIQVYTTLVVGGWVDAVTHGAPTSIIQQPKTPTSWRRGVFNSVIKFNYPDILQSLLSDGGWWWSVMLASD